VVVQSDLNNHPLTTSIFAMVTSNIRRSAEPAQVLIDVGSADGAGTGLVRTSCIKCENLYTLPQQTIIKTIGRLSSPLVQRLDDALKTSLQLT
jgi:mRNA-degrading endonuclease toxin of MazEF toxin-antitoxin module